MDSARDVQRDYEKHIEKNIEEQKTNLSHASLKEVAALLQPLLHVLEEGSITREKYLSYFEESEIDIADLFERISARAVYEKRKKEIEEDIDKVVREEAEKAEKQEVTIDMESEEEDPEESGAVTVLSKSNGEPMIEVIFNQSATTTYKNCIINHLLDNYF